VSKNGNPRAIAAKKQRRWQSKHTKLFGWPAIQNKKGCLNQDLSLFVAAPFCS